MLVGSILLTVAPFTVLVHNLNNVFVVIISLVGIVFFGFSTIFYFSTLYKFNKPVIIFNEQGFIQYSRITKKPLFFIPRDLLVGVVFGNKRPYSFNLLLYPSDNDNKYRTIIKNVKLPDYLIDCPQKVPVIILDQIVISVQLENLNIKQLYPLLKIYFNIENN